MSDPTPISRRDALKQFALLCGAAGALAPALSAQSADLPHLTPDDPTGKALGYVDDATKVDTKKYASYAAGQKCSTCMQSKGNAGDAWLSCSIFAGKAVNANGWCQVYVKKA
jgi:High potential iron-sulfur protein